MGQRIYIIGICGTGTGALAGLLRDRGHDVTGSDTHMYPPMSDRLHSWNIDVHTGYDAAHISKNIDQVIVGNVVRRNNPEAEAARHLNLPTMSMPQAVAHFGIGERHSIVVAGTHGKTTTTSLIAHLLIEAGLDPGYLIGGAPLGGKDAFHMGTGNVFVVEGDEYDTAYFDKGPKFVHYRPSTAVITSLEFDHADIFADISAVEAAFAKLIAKVPKEGRLVIWHGAHRARRLARTLAQTHDVQTFSDDPKDAQDASIAVRSWESGPDGLTFRPTIDGTDLGEMTVRLWGTFGLRNALAALGAIYPLGLAPHVLRKAMASFAGVHRRMEVRGDIGGVIVVDDFAHHPTAVAETLRAARGRWPGRRLWAIFEPRSATSRRNLFEDAYVEAFAVGDKTILAGHPRLTEVEEDQRFSPQRVVERLGEDATFLESRAEIVAHLATNVRANDCVLVLSNGDFDGLILHLLTALAEAA